MANYERAFLITDVMALHRAYANILTAAAKLVQMERTTGRDIGAKRAYDSVKAAHDSLNDDLKKLANSTAASARREMKAILNARVRPATGKSPGLADAIWAAPFEIGSTTIQTGAVGVGDIDKLNTVRQPYGYGPYWRAIEYGTGNNGVPSQTGRVLYGAFKGGASQAGPSPSQFRAHAVFLTKSRLGGGTYGLGVIHKEIEGKHFIKDGGNIAERKWRDDIASLQAREIEKLKNAGRDLVTTRA